MSVRLLRDVVDMAMGNVNAEGQGVAYAVYKNGVYVKVRITPVSRGVGKVPSLRKHYYLNGEKLSKVALLKRLNAS